MNRVLFAVSVLLVGSAAARAQDMPLSQILIDSEGWKKVENPPKRPERHQASATSGMAIADYWAATYAVPDATGKHHAVRPPARPLTPKATDRPWHYFEPTVAVVDGTGTVFVGPKDGAFIWIAREQKGGDYGVAVPFGSLRTPPGQQRITVTALAADRDGRIYAATSLGVQVLDPTGRLCGVLLPPAPGTMEFLAFEGDLLTAWVGDVKYARKLRTTGAR